MNKIEVNDKKIAFIMCINDEMYYEECCWYISRLHVPEGFITDIIAVREAPSMAAGYNAAMESSDAKYKVYMHQDVFVLNQNFIFDILAIFEYDKRIGMLGVIGGEGIPRSGIFYDRWNCGRVVSSGCSIAQDVFFKQEEPYVYVDALDGMLLVTQYDIRWREELFKQWDFYDISQSFEFIRAGYKLAIPFQKKAWTIHDCGYSKLGNYDANRKIMFESYPDFLQEDYEKHPLKYSRELTEIKKKVYLELKSLIDAGDIKTARNILESFEENGTDRKLVLLQQIKTIAMLEEQILGKEFIFSKGLLTEELLMRTNHIKFMVRRIVLDNIITEAEIGEWLQTQNISVAEIIVSVQENILDREWAIERFKRVYQLSKDEGIVDILSSIKEVLKNNEVKDGLKDDKRCVESRAN